MQRRDRQKGVGTGLPPPYNHLNVFTKVSKQRETELDMQKKEQEAFVSGKEEAMRTDNIGVRRNILLQEGARTEQARLFKLDREEARLMQEKAVRDELQITL